MGRWRCKRHARGVRAWLEASWRLGGRLGTRGAYRKHLVHVCDLGRVEAQRLVERLRPLPSHTEGIHDAGREVRAGRQAGMGRRPKRHMRGENPTKGWVKVGDRQVYARSAPET